MPLMKLTFRKGSRKTTQLKRQVQNNDINQTENKIGRYGCRSGLATLDGMTRESSPRRPVWPKTQKVRAALRKRMASGKALRPKALREKS